MDQVAQEQARRKHAEERERYWRSKYDSEALVVYEEDNADLDSMFWATKKGNIPKEMECLWEQQKKIFRLLARMITGGILSNFFANGECTSCGQKVKFAMFSCSFLRIIRQKIQVLCPVFSRKVFFRGANKVWTSKTSLSVGRQDFVQHGARVISAAKQPEILHVPLVATNELLSQSPNSIFRTSFFFRETMNSLPGINKLALKGNMNSLLKGTKLAFSGNINSLCRTKLAFSGNIKSVRGNKLAFSGNMNSLMGMETVLREIIDSE